MKQFEGQVGVRIKMYSWSLFLGVRRRYIAPYHSHQTLGSCWIKKICHEPHPNTKCSKSEGFQVSDRNRHNNWPQNFQRTFPNETIGIKVKLTVNDTRKVYFLRDSLKVQ